MSAKAPAEHAEPAPAEAAATAVPAATAGAVVLALQRTAGNRAVLSLLHQRSPRRTLQRRRTVGAGDRWICSPTAPTPTTAPTSQARSG